MLDIVYIGDNFKRRLTGAEHYPRIGESVRLRQDSIRVVTNIVHDYESETIYIYLK